MSNYIRRGKYITVKKARDAVRSSKSLASKAVVIQRREDSLPEKVGLTREEWDAIRRAEDRATVECLRKLREEHEQHERKLRQDALNKRKSENGQNLGAVELNCDSTFDSQIQGEDQR